MSDDLLDLDALIERALQEDRAREDPTTLLVADADDPGRLCFTAKAPGVLAGWPIVERVFQALDSACRFERRRADGDHVASGDVLGVCSGPVRALLSGERAALNFLGRLSGIATLTACFVAQVQGTRARILDTRKTAPGLRAVEKYAVAQGGGVNHRPHLAGAIMLKENHFATARRVRAWDFEKTVAKAAEAAARQGMALIVEVESLAELEIALRAPSQVVLLDDFAPADTKRAVALRDAGARAPLPALESSGGVTLANVRAFAETGVERISIGALTHSAPALDVSAKIEVEGR